MYICIMKTIFQYFFISLMLTLILSSCKEDKIIESETINTKDYLFAENIFNDIHLLIHNAFIGNGENKSCPTYNIINTDSSNTDTIIVNFGDGNPDDCLVYGKERRGKMIMIYSGKYRDSLSIIECTFDNFYINNNRVDGKMVIKNNGRNESGNITQTIDIIGASINRDGSINWEAKRNREIINGYNTILDPLDDQYIVTGHSSGNTSNGEDFEANITNSLFLETKCIEENVCFITAGEVELVPSGFSSRKINYGDTTCNCNVIMKLNESEYFIVIN